MAKASLPKIISRADARAAGKKTYFTGKPCRRGHLVERRVNDAHCMDCNRIWSIRCAKKWAEKAAARARRWYRQNYEKQVLALGRPQPGVCDICHCGSWRIVLDHCHETGAIRGWLCDRCNAWLGRLKHNPKLSRKMDAYLKKHG